MADLGGGGGGDLRIDVDRGGAGGGLCLLRVVWGGLIGISIYCLGGGNGALMPGLGVLTQDRGGGGGGVLAWGTGGGSTTSSRML